MCLESFLNSLKLNEETINGYKYDITSFLNFIYKRNKNDNLNKIEVLDIYAYVDYLKKKNSDRTIARKISALNKFFTYLEKNNYVNKNIFKNFKFTYKSAPNLDRLSDEQIKSLMEYSSCLNDKQKIIIYLMLFNGLTAGEIRNIKLSDIYNNIIVVNQGKDNERIIKINDALKSILSNFLKTDERLYLLNGRNGNQISRRTIQDIVKKALSAIGINEKGVSGGILKNTSVYMLKKYNNISIEGIQQFFGYKTINSARKYAEDDIVNIDMNKNPFSKM